MHYYKKLDDAGNVVGLRSSTRRQPNADNLVEIDAEDYAEMEQQFCPVGP